jgi:hypothetical protein
MKIRWLSLMVTATLLAPGAAVFADDAGTNTAKHPQVSYDSHEVKSDVENKAVYKQKMDETKAALDQAKRDLAQAKTQNDDKVIKDAQKRVKDLQKDYDKLAKKYQKEGQELSKDKQDLNEAQATRNQ